MAKTSSWWQQFLQWLDNLLLFNVQSRAFKQLYPRRLRRSGSWFVGIASFLMMLFWNWRLLLATAAGVLVMLLVYLMQEWDWKLYWSSLHRLLSGSNRQLTIAVASGGIATLSTYTMVSIWVDPHSSWIATGVILQSMGILAILGLLVWQTFGHQERRDDVKRDQMLRDLTDADPVKRLLAVRQLTYWGVSDPLYPSGQHHVTDCFRLMLSREPEPIIRDALLDGLQVLDNNQILDKSNQPLQIPLALKKSEAKFHHESNI